MHQPVARCAQFIIARFTPAERSMNNSKIALALCSLLFALPGAAQVALKPDTPSLLFWTPEQQSAGYRSMEKFYQVVTVKRGSKVHPLRKAAKQLSPTGLELHVNTDNARAIRFYEKLGFSITGDGVNPISGKPVHRMRWQP